MGTPLGSIAGRVLDRAGAPVPGAIVAIVSASEPHPDIAAMTALDGTFRLGSLRAGLYRIAARAGATASSVEVAVPAGGRADADIQLVPGATTAVERDDRVRVTNHRLYPWRCICSLLITAANGVQRTGTGFLAAHRVVLTAGDCVHVAEEGGWAVQVEVIPGRNGPERPFDSAISREVRAAPGWTERRDPEHDYGAVLLPPDRPLGEQLGWFGYAPRADDYLRQVQLNVCGYPTQPPDGAQGTQWFASGYARDVKQRQLAYDIRASDGQEGSPVWEMTAAGGRYALAIHRRIDGGIGTRITQEAFDTFTAWTREAQ